jgi:hypothetical protein
LDQCGETDFKAVGEVSKQVWENYVIYEQQAKTDNFQIECAADSISEPFIIKLHQHSSNEVREIVQKTSIR